jgi:hypothetical protein
MLAIQNCMSFLPVAQGRRVYPKDFGTVSLGPSLLAALGYEAFPNGRSGWWIGVVSEEAVNG